MRHTNPQRVARAERRVTELQAQLDAVESQLADAASAANDPVRIAEISKQHRDVRAELDSAEAELLDLYAADAA